MLILGELEPRITCETLWMGVRLTLDETEEIYQSLLGEDASREQIQEAIRGTASAKEQLAEQRAG